MSRQAESGSVWHEGELHYQQLVGVTDSARMRRAIMAEMPPIAMEFVEHQEFAALGTVDAAGAPHAWILFGPRGFLRARTTTELRISEASLQAASSSLSGHLSARPELGTLVLEPRTRRRMRINGRGSFNAAGDLIIEAEEVFSNCPKYIQTREPGSTLAVAPTLLEGEQRSVLHEADELLLKSADSFFIATRHETAGADVSHRGGRPGFIRITGEGRIRFPDYAGNNMFQTLGNLHLDDRAGLAVPDFETGDLLQLTGRAQVTQAPSQLAEFERALRVVEFTPESVTRSSWEGFVPWSFGEFSPALPA